jgi:hypothetical protein
VLVPQIEPRACQVNATLTEQDRRVLGMSPKGRRAEILAPSFVAFLYNTPSCEIPMSFVLQPSRRFLCIASSCTKRVRFKATAGSESLVYWLATLW